MIVTTPSLRVTAWVVSAALHASDGAPQSPPSCTEKVPPVMLVTPVTPRSSTRDSHPVCTAVKDCPTTSVVTESVSVLL